MLSHLQIHLQEENWGLITDDSDTKSSKKASSSGFGGPGHAEDIDLWEMDADDVWEELRAQREHWRQQAGQGAPDFPIQMRGGQWTAEHTCQATDSVRARARGEDAESFCSIYTLNKSATFSFTAYGQDFALKFAEVWSGRMQFWLDLWLEKGMFRTTTFKHSDQTLYATPGVATELLAEAPEHVVRRLHQVLAVAPRLQQDWRHLQLPCS